MVNLGFWKKVKENSLTRGTPISVLAPMADVTDPAFRRIIAKYGKPDALWTEFVSADGLCSRGREVVIRDLAFSPEERPIVAQLFTSHPEKMREAAALCAKLGFDGIDINMGCPDRTIEKQGAGAAMMKTPEVAKAVIRAAKEGAPGLPISVKTRVGYNKVEIETWLPAILEEGVAVLTVHARTRKEMSDVPARWEFVKRAVEMRDAMQGSAETAAAEGRERTLIFGNGDVLDLVDGHEKSRAAGADGAMLGRAIFGNPWLFDGARQRREVGGVNGGAIHGSSAAYFSPEEIRERLLVLVEHTELFGQLLGDIKSFAIMKKHFKAYVHGWEGAKEFRMKLMEAVDAEEVAAMVKEYLKKLKSPRQKSYDLSERSS